MFKRAANSHLVLQFPPSQARSSVQICLALAMPSTATRHSEESESSLKSALLNNALARLSPQQYRELQKFRKEFPTIQLARIKSPPNPFILFRTEYVAEKKEENEGKCLDINESSRKDKNSGGDGDTNSDKGPDGDEDQDGGKVLGDGKNSKSNPKSGGNNQTTYSKEAGVIWKRDYPSGSPQRTRFDSWSRRARVLWRTMYPNGLPALLQLKKYRPATSPSKVTSPSSPILSPSVRHKPFQPLPSPPISDSGDLERVLVGDHGDDDAPESEDALEDSDEDEDYVPKKSSRKRKSSRRKDSSRKQPRLVLLTPVSITRELSPSTHSRSSSPTPILFDTDSTLSLSLVIPDVSLLELNDEGPSTFTMPSAHFSCGSSQSRGPSEFFEQIAIGFSTEEQDKIPIMDWTQTDLMSDLDPVGLFPVVNLPYLSDSVMTGLNDPNYQLILDEAASA